MIPKLQLLIEKFLILKVVHVFHNKELVKSLFIFILLTLLL